MTTTINDSRFVSLPIDAIQPNKYNPNRMKPSRFKEYVAEVEHLGRLPKATVVRQSDDGSYEIVDGEHGWRAAKELGFEKVECEVVEIDDFEARRQTYKRNRGGKDDKVQLGRMFRDMMSQRGLSKRQLAKEISVSEGTIRNHLQYAEAADVHTAYAGKPHDKEIAKLSIHQVRMYTDMPAEMRDIWLDSGGEICLLERDTVFDVCPAVLKIRKADGFQFLRPGAREFADSLRNAIELGEWAADHAAIVDLKKYITPVGKLGLPPDVLEHLPCRHEGDTIAPVLTPVEWSKIVKDSNERSDDVDGLLALIDSAVRVALRDKSVDFSTVCGPQAAEMLQLLEDAPDFIRAADFLSLEEQFALAHVEADADKSLVGQAQGIVVQHFRCRRTGKGCENTADITLDSKDVEDAFYECLDQFQQAELRPDEDALFSDPEALLDMMVERLTEASSLDNALIDEVPARDVLRDRLDAIAWPEFHLIASLLIDDAVVPPGDRWLQALVAGTNLEGK